MAINVACIEAIAPLDGGGSIIDAGSTGEGTWHVTESPEAIISAIRGAGGVVVDVPGV